MCRMPEFLATLVVYVVGVFLNYLVPSRVFEIVLNFASLESSLVGVYHRVPDCACVKQLNKAKQRMSVLNCLARPSLPG